MRRGARGGSSGGVVAFCVCAATLAACARSDRIDLAAQLPVAQVWHETRLVDFGTPAARSHLLLGWGRDETWDDGRSMLWALGTRSRLEFYVAAPRPLILTLQCGSVPDPDAPPQTIHFAVNGAPQGRLELLRGQRVYRVPIAGEALRAGVNTLELRYAYARQPIRLSPASDDGRPLSVAWSWMTFDGLVDGAAPTAAEGPDGGSLTLPSGSEVDFFVDLPDGATLGFDAVRPLAAADAADLVVSVERDGAAARQATVDVRATPAPWEQSLDAGGPTRIRLRATGAAGAPGGVVLVAPRLQVPRPAVRRCRAPRPPATATTPVVLYVIDTLRADHLGCYGYDRPTSPHLDAFAADAVRFAYAVAQSPWTRPSMASIMTGLTPPRHNAIGAHGVLSPMPTLAGVLAARGYETAGFITNSVISAEYGLNQGFGSYVLLPEEPIPGELGGRPRQVMHQPAAALHAAALRWLDERRSTAPPFLYLHASDPHNPYLPPSPFREALAGDADLGLGLPHVLDGVVKGSRELTAEERRQMVALYDADIASVDDAFGRLVADLRARGLYDDALIVVVADHGEGFGEHDHYSHANSLYAELLHVPLLIKFPRRWRAGTVVGATAQQVDILPTILDALGVDPPAVLDGTSLLPALDCPDAPRPPAYSTLGKPSTIASLLVGRYKLIYSIVAERPDPPLSLYDIAADPRETHDLADDQPVRAGALFARLPAFRDAVAVGAEQTLVPDGALEERMRALGYLH